MHVQYIGKITTDGTSITTNRPMQPEVTAMFLLFFKDFYLLAREIVAANSSRCSCCCYCSFL